MKRFLLSGLYVIILMSCKKTTSNAVTNIRYTADGEQVQVVGGLDSMTAYCKQTTMEELYPLHLS